MKNKVMLVDTPGFIHRAWHATAPLHTSTGIPVNAVYGFTRMIINFINNAKVDHIAFCFDLNGRVARLSIDPEYKANRPKTDASLDVQYMLIIAILKAFNFEILMYDGWEADDVIASVAKKMVDGGDEVTIVTSDKDFLQLLRPGVEIFDPVKEQALDAAYVRGRYGVEPSQMLEYQALVGDVADNIKKVPGVGPKTAAKLIGQYGTVEGLIAGIETVEPSKTRDAILANIDTLLRARKLVEFNSNLPIDISMSNMKAYNLASDAVLALFKELEFKSLIQDMWGVDLMFDANGEAK